MVVWFEIQVHAETLLGGGDCGQTGQSQDHISEQQPGEEDVGHRGGTVQGRMLRFEEV